MAIKMINIRPSGLFKASVPPPPPEIEYVAVVDNKIWVSYDGNDWIDTGVTDSSISVSNTRARKVIYDPVTSRWLVSFSNKIGISSDGLTWTVKNGPAVSSLGFVIATNGTRINATSFQSSVAYQYTSTNDATSWSAAGTNTSSSHVALSYFSENDLFWSVNFRTNNTWRFHASSASGLGSAGYTLGSGGVNSNSTSIFAKTANRKLFATIRNTTSSTLVHGLYYQPLSNTNVSTAWTVATPTISNPNTTGLAVSTQTGRILWSTPTLYYSDDDGTSFTVVSPGINIASGNTPSVDHSGRNSIAYSPTLDRFVGLLSDFSVVYSATGLTWTAASNPFPVSSFSNFTIGSKTSI